MLAQDKFAQRTQSWVSCKTCWQPRRGGANQPAGSFVPDWPRAPSIRFCFVEWVGKHKPQPRAGGGRRGDFVSLALHRGPQRAICARWGGERGENVARKRPQSRRDGATCRRTIGCLVPGPPRRRNPGKHQPEPTGFVTRARLQPGRNRISHKCGCPGSLVRRGGGTRESTNSNQQAL